MRQLLTVWSVLLLSLSLAAQQWQRVPSTAHPPKDAQVAMAYDAGRDRIVCVADEMIGGMGFSYGRFTTWEWDGARWLQRATATTPTATGYRHALAYDPTRRRSVLVNRFGETWSFDGVDWQQDPIGGGGGAYPSLAFDAARGVLVLACGSSTWHGIYEVQNGAWTLRASFTPLGEGAAIGFDPISGRIIAFGGLDLTGFGSVNVNTTRSWDGTMLTTLAPTTVPSGRAEHVLVNDPFGLLLLIGGNAYLSPLGTLAEVHAWNGTDWVVQPSLPAPRMGMAVAPHGASLWLFGGRDIQWGSPMSHELLRRDLAGAWTTVPQLVCDGLAARDTLRARTVGLRNGRTLEFDGYRWIDVNIPFPGGSASMAFHAQTGRIVACDGAGATWLYDGLAWTQAVTTIAPPPRGGAGMGYDPVRNVVVLFGGNVGPNLWVNDVWEWNGAAWSNPQPAIAPPAGDAAIAWDGQNLVVVSSNPPLSNWSTSTWNGTTFSTLAVTPGVIRSPRLAHDPALGLVAVWTPGSSFATADACSQFTGSVWQPLGSGAVADRTGAGALVFDGNRGQLVLHDAVNERDLILSPWLATRQQYGASCSGSTLLPRLSAPVLPQLGAGSISDVDRATPASFAFVLADLAQANVPLPGGCTVLLQNPIVLAGAATNGAGFASATFAIPPAPALRGIDLFEQALVLDPAGALLGFANLTNGLQLRIGD